MNNTKLLFYEEYEQFYKMTEKSKTFESFCRDAFGQDFSQDGFSDINQINRILRHIPSGKDIHILDIRWLFFQHPSIRVKQEIYLNFLLQ